MICEPGDDEQHGSSVVCDVNALQALSRRVHLGKFVAESKFQVLTCYTRYIFYQAGGGWGGEGGPSVRGVLVLIVVFCHGMTGWRVALFFTSSVSQQ